MVTGARRHIHVLGVTGSIGRSTADLLGRHADRFSVGTVTAHRQVEALATAARQLGAERAVIADPAGYAALKRALSGSGIACAAGLDALEAAAALPADITVAGIVGAAGIRPTFAALGGSRAIALANKEVLVCAGALLVEAAQARGTALLPTDSEHNAVFQLLAGRDATSVEEMVLTASGGPFRSWSREAMARARPADAVRHPTWPMGRKISVDSASLVNKGLELMEAQHLFALAPERLSVLVHPQSVVHALVRFRDGSLLAQLARPDMRVPIAVALAWPERIDSGVAALDLGEVATLTFEAPDGDRFPGLELARAAMVEGGGAPCVFNAANEVAVAAFLDERIGFLDIPRLLAALMEAARRANLMRPPGSLDDILDLDLEIRGRAAALVPQIAVTSRA